MITPALHSFLDSLGELAEACSPVVAIVKVPIKIALAILRSVGYLLALLVTVAVVGGTALASRWARGHARTA